MSLKSTQIEDSISSTDDDVKILMPHILNLCLRHDSNEKQVICAINRLLSATRTRSQGLEYLNLIINNCSSEGISANALSWINNCLVKHPGDILKEQKLLIARKIMRNAYQQQEFSKKFLSDYMAKIIEMCLSKHANPNETEAALDTLIICMIIYPSWFSSHKIRIASFVERFLDFDNIKLVQKAAIAFHYTQQIGNAGINSINHEINYSSGISKLCATVHSLYDTLFENETELENYDKLGDTFTFITLPYTSEKMLHIITKRIINSVKFLKTMLLTAYPAPKNIKPKQILDVIGRGLALHLCITSEEERSSQDFIFSLLLTRIQIQLLQLLKAFIIWSQSNLLPFSYVVSKILVDALNRCQKCECFSTNCVYYETVYKILGYWIHIVKTLPLCYQEQLIACILNDITPSKVKVTLNIAVDSDSSTKSKKSKMKEKVFANILRTMQAKTTDKKEFEENKCIFALKTLSDLLFSTPLGLNVDVLKKLYSVVISTILDIHTSKQIHPYTNQKCQEKLYDVLVAFYEQDTLPVFPPLQLTLEVLNMGANNPNRYISFTCEKGLSMLEKLCQPVCSHAEAAVNEISQPPGTSVVDDIPNAPIDEDETADDVPIDETGDNDEKVDIGQEDDRAEVEEQEQHVNDEVPELNQSLPSEVWSETTEILDNNFEAEHDHTEAVRPKTPESLPETSQSKVVILSDEVVGDAKEPVAESIEPVAESIEPVAESISSNVDKETEVTDQTDIPEDGPPAKKLKIDEEPPDEDGAIKIETKSIEDDGDSDIYVGFVDVVKDY